ncbi:hypothetical protein BH20ACT9_BH20ACT9_04160 [soil metagenome]
MTDRPPPGAPRAIGDGVHSPTMSTTDRQPGVGARPASPPAVSAPVPRLRRRRTVVRRLEPWSVLKISLLFYSCLWLILLVAMLVLWTAVNRLGIVDDVLRFLRELSLTIRIDGAGITRVIVGAAALNVVLWSVVNVFLAYLYNLLADLVGGLRVTLLDEE